VWTPPLGSLHYWLIACLLLIGLHGMLAQRNLLKKLMAMNILQVSVILFFIVLTAKTQATGAGQHGTRDARECWALCRAWPLPAQAL